MDKPGWCSPGGGLNSTMYNATTRGRTPQRRHDRARRLRRRIRPAAAARGAARSTSASRSSPTRNGSHARPELAALLDRLESRGRGSAAARARRGDPARGDGVPALDRVAARAEARRGRPSGTSTCSRARCSTSTTWRTSCGSSTSPGALERGTAADPADPPRPGAPPTRGTTAPGERTAGGSPHRGTGRGAGGLRPVHDDGPRPSRPPRACLETIRDEAVEGDLVECGTGRGGGAIFLRGFLDAHELDDRQVWVVDTSIRHRHRRRRSADQVADLNIVRDGFARFGLLDERVRFLQGAPSTRSPTRPIEKIALLRIGGDLERRDRRRRSTRSTTRSRVGGFVVVDQFGTPSRCSMRRGVPRPAAHRRAARADRLGAARAGGRSEPGAETAVERSGSELSSARPFRRRRRDPQGPLGRRRLLQHAARSATHAALAVARVPAGHRRPRLRGDRRRERVRRRRRSSARNFVRSFGPEFRYLDLGADAHPVAGACAQPGHRARRPATRSRS